MMSAQLETPTAEAFKHEDVEEEKVVEAPAASAPDVKKRKSLEEDAEGEIQTVFELSAKRRVTVEEFKGNLLVSIREFYEDRNDGIMKPGKKGISLTLEQWEQVKAAMPGVDRAVASMTGGKKSKKG